MAHNFRCRNRTFEPRLALWQGRGVNVPTAHLKKSLRLQAAKENWRGSVERMQQSVMENAVSAMNGVISSLEKTRVTPADKAWEDTDIYLQTAPSDEAIETTRLNIKTKASVLRPVTEIPGKGLEEYLSLPVEDYNSLDPKVVQFLGENRFRLTPPLEDWFRINLHPEIILRIQPEPEHARVQLPLPNGTELSWNRLANEHPRSFALYALKVLFVCERIKFGDSKMDEAGGLTFVSALSREEVTKGGSKEVFLVSAAQVGMSLDTPYRASRMAPIRALEALSSRVLQATLKACMGPYLDRLIVDYEDWAEGRPRRQEQIQPQEAAQLFLEAEGSVVQGFAAADAGQDAGSHSTEEPSGPSAAGKGPAAKRPKH